MRMRAFLSIAVMGATGVTASADLMSAFGGFETINEVGVSGLRSSYHTDSVNNEAVTGPSISSSLANFGPQRVEYPSIGAVPSPGGTEGHFYDQGVLGWRSEGEDLVVRLASGMNPLTGRYSGQHERFYGQGDMFLTVGDGDGVRQFALLNSWADDEGPVDLGYSSALTFHTGAGVDGGTREGNLVRLTANNHVQRSSGTGAFGSGNAPDGLDIRVFAKNGTDLGDTNLTHSSLTDAGQDWYIMTWTVPMGLLSSDESFSVAFHSAATCSNDQIGGVGIVPEPASLGLFSLAALALVRRR